MKEQENSEDRRDLERQLARVLMNIEDFENVRAEFIGTPLDIRQIELPSGEQRFVISSRKTGKVHDSFTFDAARIEEVVSKGNVDKHYDRDRIFDEEQKSDFLWCLHCERAYNRGQHRKMGDLQMCPYGGCDGDTVIDAWDWETVREGHPDYPPIPVEGKVYPLYDVSTPERPAPPVPTKLVSEIPADLSALAGFTIDSTLFYQNQAQRNDLRPAFCDIEDVLPALKERLEKDQREALSALLKRRLGSGVAFHVRAEVSLLTSPDDDEKEEAFNSEVDVFTGEDDYDDVVAIVDDDQTAGVVIAALEAAFVNYLHAAGVPLKAVVIKHELSGHGYG